MSTTLKLIFSIVLCVSIGSPGGIFTSFRNYPATWKWNIYTCNSA